MPATQAPTNRSVENFGYRQKFSHDSEVSHPGYYAVTLDDCDIRVELSATLYVGAHRYTFNSLGSRKAPYILLDASYALCRDACWNATFTIDPVQQQITGWVLNGGGLSARFGGYVLYYVIVFNETFTDWGSWADDGVHHNVTSQLGTTIGAYLGFDSGQASTMAVEMFVGVSFISIEQAKRNLASVAALTFDWINQNAQNEWFHVLSTVETTGGSEYNQTTFYSALYKAYAVPTTFSEVGEVYLGFDDKVHKLTNGTKRYFTDMSDWDTFRTQFPFLSFMMPDIMQDIVRSMVAVFEQGGDLSRWPLANGYTGCMIATPQDLTIVDAWLQGLSFDYQTAYAGMKQGATEPQEHDSRTSVEYYVNIGYVPYETDTKGCSNTLEYAYCDWAISKMALGLGYESDFEMFNNRSQNYLTQWNADIQFFCPRYTNGTMKCPDFLLYVFSPEYVEGDAWHWRWFVPQDPIGLIELFGSAAAFVEQLEIFFNRSVHFPNILPNPYYWAGNEPDLLAAYLFAYAGRVDLTQKWVRDTLVRRYNNNPDGLPGNDDYGTMSAWLLWGFIGFYPLAGNSTYILGSPVFDEVVLHRPAADLVVRAYNQPQENIYVAAVQLNGKPLDRPFISFEQIADGGLLEFWMSAEPTSWGQFDPLA